MTPSTPRPTWNRRSLTRWGLGMALWGALCSSLAVGVALTATPATAQAAEMVSVRSRVLNMRSGPGQNHDVQWQLRKGYPLQVIGRQGNWLKIRDFEDDTGWVSRSLTSRLAHHIVQSRVANVRSGPGTRYRVTGKAIYGEVLRTLEKRPSWVRVERENGAKGWVSRSLLWGW